MTARTVVFAFGAYLGRGTGPVEGFALVQVRPVEHRTPVRARGGRTRPKNDRGGQLARIRGEV